MLDKQIDKSKRAKPRGWRFKGSKAKLGNLYYKQPSRVLNADELKKAKDRGLVSYEPRLNKSDSNQSKRFRWGGLPVGFFTQELTFFELFSSP